MNGNGLIPDKEDVLHMHLPDDASHAPNTTGLDSNSNANSNVNGIDWRTIFDGSDPAHAGRRSSISSGKSPGRGAEAFPLHIVHTIDLTGDDGNGVEMSHMRLFIRKGAKPWGVSIWQLDVKGYSAADTDEV